MKCGMIAGLAALAAMAVVACSTDEDATPNATKDPVPGSGATTSPATASGRAPGEIPRLNLEAGVPATSDAGTPPDVPGAPNQVPPEPEKRTIWAVDSRNHLLRILAETPSDVIDVTALDLPAGEVVEGLDFRPMNGTLYALTSASRLYTVDLTTAKTTPLGPPTTPRVQGQSIGFDVNPVADKIRVHTDVDQNLRLDPATGEVAGTDAMLAFAADDPNFLQSPNVVGAAYTNSVAPAPATTTLFAIDSTRDLLLKVPNPNDGLMTTVGPLGIDIVALAGFDIWGTSAAAEAYVAARIAGTGETNLYRIDLDTGAAALVGTIAHAHPIRGIAVRP